ncbi:uncharacterized protein [Temnothorax nylanderi]|uniref:uncharacterized protein n=1 Tax=Temnothorax nylanderi TaxID=102681 RepID=UPI003A8B28E6
MSLDQSAMLNGQHELFVRISKAVDNLKKMGQANITLSAVETRIRILDDHWAKFESQHDLIRACYKDRYAESEYAKSDLLDQAESAYVLQRSVLSELANRYKTASASTSSTPPKQGGDRASRTSLPRINLPKFSDAYEDWPSFRDFFRSVIGDNSSISHVERLHYLRSCLQGSAENLIRSLTITGENYDRAWAILCKHYKNKKELIRSNFATFTAVAKMKAATADELSRVHNAVTSAVNAQESIGRPINSHGMDLFNHLVVELFDSRTRLEWESSTGDSFEPPTHETLMNFITKRILTLNAANPKNTTKPASEPSRSAKTHVAKRSEPSQCPLCKGKHSLMGCPDFKAKTASERKTVVETNNLCFNCLGNHLVAKCQSTRNCFTCNSRHHSMLHDAYVSTPKPAAEVSTLSAVGKAEDRKAILLATARVTIADRHGDSHEVRALIDQGSEVSIVSESLVQRLRLPRSRTRVSIFGIGGSHSGSTRGKVSLNVASRTTGDSFTVVAFVLPRLSLYQGSTNKCSTTWPHLQGLPLADPRFAANDPVELLLGAEVCATILEDGLRRGEPQTPIAQKTILGWILSGGCCATSLVGHLSSFQGTADHDLAELVRRFWEQESEPPASVTLNPEEEECEQHFVRTHERTPSGRYVVRLPFASPPKNLVETRKPANEPAHHGFLAHSSARGVLPPTNTPRRSAADARNTPPPPLDSARPGCRPIHIRTTKGRGHRAHKAFIAVFVCLVTKAVHLEVVSDYTTEAFLAALRRFTARRGLYSDIYSDCGTNFIGADRALQNLFRASSSDGRRIAHDVSIHGIRWHFNPPAAPHFGGLWEAAVKSTKFHLRRVIGETTLTFEEMATFLAQVEACLYSRPLQALSDDPDDVTALTPGHFLIGAPLLAAPEPSLGERPDNTLSRWQLVQRMRDHFWQRWSRECIQHLAPRPKWLSAEATPAVGSLCLIRSEIAPPNRWPLARIVRLHPGDDGVVRVVTVRTAASEFVRPLVKLVMLPGAADTTTTAENT